MSVSACRWVYVTAIVAVVNSFSTVEAQQPGLSAQDPWHHSPACPDPQTSSGATFKATLCSPRDDERISILTLTNLGPTLYSPLTISISGTPRDRTHGSWAPADSRDHDQPFSFSAVVKLPQGSLLPGETQTLRIILPRHPERGFIETVTSVTGLTAPADLGITVTMPTAGQTPLGPSFVVTGTLTAQGVAGVSVDGIPGCLVGSMFFVNAFQPQVSPNTFTAAATDIDGGQKSLSVTISPSAKGLQVTPLPSCGGVAPLTATVNVSLTTSDGDSISTETIDFGAGAGPGPVSPGAQSQYVYSTPGLYTVTVNATTVQGASLTQHALVSAQTPAQAFAPILANVSLLQSALTAQDVVRALSYHTYTAQLRYLPLLTQTGIDLRALGTVISSAQPLVVVGDYAEVVVTARGPNPRQSSVVLVRDNYGIWRVDSW